MWSRKRPVCASSSPVIHANAIVVTTKLRTNATNQPITCQNRLRQPMADQLEFDCDGYTNGTSGGPFLSEVDQATGQGLVTGVIGGYQEGGYTPQISYSAVLGANAAALYRQAVADG